MEEINEKKIVEELKNKLDQTIFQKNFYATKMYEYEKLQRKTEIELKETCSHKNIKREKDSGPYPETYIICQDCGLYL